MNEGIHIENISGVILLRPTVSPIIYKQLLEKIEFSWNRDQSRWENGFAFAKRFTDEGGDINTLPNGYLIDGFNLTRWIRAQRDRYSKNKISRDRIKQLEMIGLKWTILASKWEESYVRARGYFIENGDLNVKLHYECPDGFKLGVWIVNQRTKYRNNRLDADQTVRLEAIGMIWNTHDVFWENGIAHAREYHTEHGGLNVPGKYVCDDGYRLGQWLQSIRVKFKKGELSAERSAELEKLGIEWEHSQNAWEKGYAHAKAYFDVV